MENSLPCKQTLGLKHPPTVYQRDVLTNHTNHLSNQYNFCIFLKLDNSIELNYREDLVKEKELKKLKNIK